MFDAVRDFFKDIDLTLDVANVVIVVVTVMLGIIAVWEFRRVKRKDLQEKEDARADEALRWSISREESAKSLYKEYLIHAIKYPELSSAIYNKDDPISVDQYDSFVSLMLYSLDELILRTNVEDNRATLEDQVRVHQSYIEELLSPNDEACEEWRTMYSPGFLQIIDEKLAALNAAARLSAPAPTLQDTAPAEGTSTE